MDLQPGGYENELQTATRNCTNDDVVTALVSVLFMSVYHPVCRKKASIAFRMGKGTNKILVYYEVRQIGGIQQLITDKWR